MDQAIRTYCLRAIATLHVAEPQEQGAADSPVLRQLGNGLMVAYLVDEGDQFSHVQRRHLAQAGLSEEKLHEQALFNLSSVIGSQAEVRKFGSIYKVAAGGVFEASLILFDEFWSSSYEELAKEDFIAALPARDILAFGDSADPDTLGELRQLCAEKLGKVDHPLTSTLYRRTKSGWKPVFSH